MKQGTNLHVYTWSRLGGFAPARPQCSAFTSYSDAHPFTGHNTLLLVGASVSEPPLVDSTDALSR